MSIVHEYDGADLVAPATVMLKEERQGFSAKALGCEAMTCSVIVEDESGALDFVGHKTWRIRETTAPADNRVMWAGFVADQGISRGSDPTYPVGTGRRWELDLIECNEFVARRLLVTGANRPSETVSARGTWLLTTAGFTGGLIVDGGLIEASSVVMDPMDYTGSTGKDVLDGMAVACGLTPHIRYREATDDYQLIFLDFLRSGLDLSTLRISNVAADVDLSLTWPPNPGATLRRSPVRRASGIGVPYPGGFSYQQDAGTQAIIGDVDLLAPAGDVKTAATAATLGLRLLDQQADQEERVTGLTLRLPAADVNDVWQGQRIEAKFSHYPSPWTDFRACRVVQRTVRRPENQTQAFYDVDLELVPCAPTTPSNAQISGPQDNIPPAVYDGAGGYKIGWVHDGDNPFSGATPSPLAGLFAYVGAVGLRTGIQCTGSGVVDLVRLAFSVSEIVDGAHTFTANITLNDVIIATDTQVSSGGLRLQAWELGGAAGVGTELRATAVSVSSGDIFRATVSTSTGTAVQVIPTGVGNNSHWLWVTGSLA